MVGAHEGARVFDVTVSWTCWGRLVVRTGQASASPPPRGSGGQFRMSPGIFLVGEDGALVEMRSRMTRSRCFRSFSLGIRIFWRETKCPVNTGVRGCWSSGKRALLRRKAAGIWWWIDQVFLDQDGVPPWWR